MDWELGDWELGGGKGWMFISKPREGSVMRAYCKSTDKDTDPEGNWNWISAREGVEPDFSVNREGKRVYCGSIPLPSGNSQQPT